MTAAVPLPDRQPRIKDAPTANVLGFLGKQGERRSFTPGSLIANRFEILRFLNRGGMGEVYEAWDAELKERVALKAVGRRLHSTRTCWSASSGR